MYKGFVTFPHQKEEKEISGSFTSVDYASCKICGTNVTLGYIYIEKIGSMCQDCYDEVMEAVETQQEVEEKECDD